MSQEFYNHIATLSINHFNSLSKKGKPNAKEWTVLSCIIKENTTSKDFEVVALGTGSKCIGKSKMSPKGDVLNDSHGEVICRRAFLRYLYEELDSECTDVFTSNVLNACVRFHFFTSHIPCGDAAIFAKQSTSEFGDVLVVSSKRPCQIPLRNAKRSKVEGDVYRTGAKCLPNSEVHDLQGSGCEYHILGAVRTKPGRGDPTLSVSCSDKLAKWCQIGLQGALLARLIKEPIFLSSFTICSKTPFNKESLQRALYSRLGVLESTMMIGQASLGFDYCKSDSKNPCPSSIIWFKSKFASHEIAVNGIKQGVTKKVRAMKAARLGISKIELFRNFLRVASSFGDAPSDVYYDEAKAKAVDYQQAWSIIKKEGFKCWTVKDKSLQHFVVD